MREPAGAALRHRAVRALLSVGRAFDRGQAHQDGDSLHRRRPDAGVPRGAAGACRRAKVSDVYCDLNGEPYRADEFGFAALRTKEHFASASDFVAPADCWGDVAAAGGAAASRAGGGRRAQGLREGAVVASCGPVPRAASAARRCWRAPAATELSRAGHHQGQRHRQFAGPQGQQRHLDGDHPRRVQDAVARRPGADSLSEHLAVDHLDKGTRPSRPTAA